MEGKSQRRRGETTTPVCLSEKVSVERIEMRTAQRSAGHQARSQGGMPDLGGRDWSKSEMARGVCAKSEVDMQLLFSTSIVNEK